MDLHEAMQHRHSVRMYTDETVDAEALHTLATQIADCNAQSGLHIQMASGLQDAFCGYKTHYGRFTGVHNAIALIADIPLPYDLKPQRPSRDNANDAKSTAPTTPTTDLYTDHIPQAEAATEQTVGYYGERLALTLTQLGLACSWAVLDDATDGWWHLTGTERVVWVIAFGHAARPGAKHHSKPLEALCSLPASLGHDATLTDAPKWFQHGIEAASLAPTSLSQQPFVFELAERPSTESAPTSAAGRKPSQPDSDQRLTTPAVIARATPGLFAHVGLGCAKCHFEIGAGTGHFVWKQ
jgi:hypothetical protein